MSLFNVHGVYLHVVQKLHKLYFDVKFFILFHNFTSIRLNLYPWVYLFLMIIIELLFYFLFSLIKGFINF